MSEIAFIDFEAPALAGRVCPIEVGVAIWQRGDAIRTWSSLIWRKPDAPWSEASEAIHHIKREALETAPKPPMVAAWLNSLLGPIGVAHADGIPYDDTWCLALFREARVERRFAVEPMPSMNILQAWRIGMHLRRNKEVPHRAGADAVRLMRAHAAAYRERPDIIEIR
jgi:hypothetical protein